MMIADDVCLNHAVAFKPAGQKGPDGRFVQASAVTSVRPDDRNQHARWLPLCIPFD
jgi:hypothetical protein